MELRRRESFPLVATPSEGKCTNKFGSSTHLDYFCTDVKVGEANRRKVKQKQRNEFSTA